ncbi:MAG: queuosine precursor transporter [Alphaproteobacteria bacterium]
MAIPRGIVFGVIAMTVIVVASNVLVQYPINDWLTWGAFTYPVAFLVTDLTNRALGPGRARQVVYAGFALAVILSIVFATPRIAVASGTAFLIAQLIDVRMFDRLRASGGWWTAPLVSSTVASVIDTILFFSIAFAGSGLPWVTWAVGDFGAKMCVALAMLLPFRVLMQITRPQRA